MADINLWSVDAENNNMTPPHGWPEGMNYSAVNDAARENMAAIKRWFDDISGKLDATGQANIYAVTLNAGYSSYFRGMTFRCKIPATNTGASTINVNAIGPRNIVRANGSALEAGMLRQGHVYSFYFDGTNFRVDATTLVPDGALSDNVPLKNAPNVFTQSGSRIDSAAITIAANLPSIGLYETDAPTDAKYVQVRLDNGRLSIRARTDADELGATLFSASRDGATWQDVSWEATGEIDLTAPTLDFNGNADISGTLAVGGTITGNGSGLTSLNASNLSSGTVPDARLSSNVALLDRTPQTFTGINIFRSELDVYGAVEIGPSANRALQLGTYGSDSTDIVSVVNGATAFGALIRGMHQGHLVLALRENDSTDSVSIISGGGDYASDETYDTLVAQFLANGNARIGGTLSWGGGDPIASSDDLWHTGNFDPDTKANASHTHSASDITSGTLSDARLPATIGGNKTFSDNVTVGGTITGNGSGLTNLNADNLSSGTVPSARLPATIGGDKTFSDNVTVGGTITGNGSGLTNLNASNISSGTVPSDRLPSTIGGNKTFSNNVTINGAARAGTAATSTSGTLAAGQIHHRSSNTTVPSMNAGQWVAVQNTSTSSITLSQGSGVTLELGGTTTTGNRTLLPKGFAFIYFRANGIGVVHGSGVS